jgi:uncharacterized protein (TIGR02145 family)
MNKYLLLSAILILSQIFTMAQTVTIVDHVWTAKNLDVATFSNGDPIPQAKTNESWQEAGENMEPAWCYYENNPANGTKYGKLYNWWAVIDTRGLAPVGWHIPSAIEMITLGNYGTYDVPSPLKNKTGWNTYKWETGGEERELCPKCKKWSDEYKRKVACHLCKDTRWIDIKKKPVVKHSVNGGSNNSGFSALPGGARDCDGTFVQIGYAAFFWTTDNDISEDSHYKTEDYLNRKIISAFSKKLSYNTDNLVGEMYNKCIGMSIRCVKN